MIVVRPNDPELNLSCENIPSRNNNFDAAANHHGFWLKNEEQRQLVVVRVIAITVTVGLIVNVITHAEWADK